MQKTYISLLFVSGLLVLFVAGVVILYGSFTSLTEAAIEKLAGEALGVSVRIEALDIDPEQGAVMIRGLTVANPKGYSRRPAIEAGVIDIKAGNLNTQLLGFDDIRVSGMNVRVEVGDRGTNLSTLRDQAQARLQRSAQVEGQQNPVHVKINHVVFSGPRLEPAVKEAIAGHLSPVILADIHLRALGEDGQGVQAADALSQILAQVINVSLRRAAQEGYLDSLSPEIQQAIGARLSLKEQLLEDAKAAINRAPSDAENLKEGVKKIFRVNE